jgi:tripartite-type tricarboxylate transporter receptor subunit TctC
MGIQMMKLPRRKFMRLAAGAAVLPVVPRLARAQAYPSRPVRIVVPFPAAGLSDIVTRLIGQWLSERLGSPFVIENRPGAASNLGTEIVVNAPPDGYTLLNLSSANATNATMYEKLNFNFIRDIAPVASLVRFPYVIEVNPSVPIKTIPELIGYAKANPGKLSFASAGTGTPAHIAGELFKQTTGIDMVHVPYRGAALALTDLIGGQVQVMVDNMAASLEHIRAGRVRALAVTTAARLEWLPDVPTVGEFVPGFEASSMNGVGAPKRTPTEIVDQLNKEINTALTDPKLKVRIAELGLTPLVGSPADLERLIANETEKWGKVIRAANIKAD